MIKQAVPSGGDCGIALRPVEACDFPKRGKLGCIIFGRGGLRSRIPRTLSLNKTNIPRPRLINCPHPTSLDDQDDHRGVAGNDVTDSSHYIRLWLIWL